MSAYERAVTPAEWVALAQTTLADARAQLARVLALACIGAAFEDDGTPGAMALVPLA